MIKFANLLGDIDESIGLFDVNDCDRQLIDDLVAFLTRATKLTDEDIAMITHRGLVAIVVVEKKITHAMTCLNDGSCLLTHGPFKWFCIVDGKPIWDRQDYASADAFIRGAGKGFVAPDRAVFDLAPALISVVDRLSFVEGDIEEEVQMMLEMIGFSRDPGSLVYWNSSERMESLVRS